MLVPEEGASDGYPGGGRGRIQTTFGLVCEEVIDFAGSTVVCNNIETLVIHVENQVLTLGDGTQSMDS